MDTNIQNKAKSILNSNQIRFKQVLQEAEQLRARKYACYGDSYKLFGTTGIIIRINDKTQRLINMAQDPNLGPVGSFESMRDTAIDLLNYSAMLVMELDEEKQKIQEKMMKK